MCLQPARSSRQKFGKAFLSLASTGRPQQRLLPSEPNTNPNDKSDSRRRIRNHPKHKRLFNSLCTVHSKHVEPSWDEGRVRVTEFDQ